MTGPDYLTMESCHPPICPSMKCTYILGSLCCMKSELGMQVHCTGSQRGGSVILQYDSVGKENGALQCTMEYTFAEQISFVIFEALPTSTYIHIVHLYSYAWLGHVKLIIYMFHKSTTWKCSSVFTKVTTPEWM